MADGLEGLREAAGRHLVQPWPSAGKIGTDAPGAMDDGDGVHVLHEDGRRLIDGPAGMWCVNAGHGRVELADAMRDQAMRLSYASPWSTTTAPALELAERLAGHAPGALDRVFLTTGGTSAVETALRLRFFLNDLRGRPGKKLIVTRDRAYHGSSFLTGALNGRPRDQDWMEQPGERMIRLSCPDPFRRPAGMTVEAFTDHLIAEFRTVIAERGADRIGAFIAEPIMASGGVVVPPEGYLRRMEALCRAHDILFIADEVVTGFGRLGEVFASGAVFGLSPDMITFAKGVTSGYFPLGGVMISSALLEELRASNHPEATFAHGLTYSSHPIGAAVALKNLDLLEGGLLERARETAPYFQAALKRLEALDLVGEVRGLGMMACVECVADKESRNPLALDLEVGKRIDRHCQERGLLVRPLIQMCVMSPPLIITRPQIDRMAEVLDQAIRATMDELTRERLWRG
ncbi:MAG: aminotransferase [Paracoccaceae bacterium]|nr:aminotransferase [Paracoccaceae bacterium]